ncbi:FadR/GntR family transcriptional regulator [Bauldia sp.]|uniref:FadR/GntR family transcriptional regulator n=1 Tax=Bauldia sp. TaxID=2575872 RepID=UPI003BA88D0E
MTSDTASLNIAQQIVDSLGRRIVRGDLTASGPSLVEQDIMMEYGASRNAVREAVKTLAGKNLVRSERRVGTIVQPAAAWNLFDPQIIDWMLSDDSTSAELLKALSELRMIVEPAAAALAAERATHRQILELLDCYDGMCAHVDDDERAIPYDVRFHETLLEACGNPLLRSLAHSFGLLLRANFKLSIQVDQAFLRNLEDHLMIAEAVRDRDPVRARQASITLLRKNEKDMEEVRAASAAS